jgi:hypothetical protein
MTETLSTSRLSTAVVSVIACIYSNGANAQMAVDVTNEEARHTVGKTYITDLSVNDTALIYDSFCVKDGGLYVLGWTTPADLAESKYDATGIILKIEVLPGKRLRGTYVDAAQAQMLARGKVGATKVLSTKDYNEEVRNAVSRIFEGGFFGSSDCDQEQLSNPLRELKLFPLDSINGHSRISDLLNSVSAKP